MQSGYVHLWLPLLLVFSLEDISVITSRFNSYLPCLVLLQPAEVFVTMACVHLKARQCCFCSRFGSQYVTLLVSTFCISSPTRFAPSLQVSSHSGQNSYVLYPMHEFASGDCNHCGCKEPALVSIDY